MLGIYTLTDYNRVIPDIHCVTIRVILTLFNIQFRTNMTIQDISISNNQRKSLMKALPDESVLIETEDGVVISVADYAEYKLAKNKTPVELIIGEDVLDADAEFWVFN